MNFTPNYGENVTSSAHQTSTEEWVPPDFDVSATNILLAITLIVLDVVTIFGNLLVLLAFVIEKRLLQPFNIFILNLAVTDFSVAVTAMTFYTLDTLLGYWPFGQIMCGIWIYFDFAMTFASVFTLVLISVDRFYCVTWAIHYRMHNSKTKAAIALGTVWFCVVAIWTPPFIGDRMKHNEPHSCIWEPSDNTEFVIFVAVIGHYIPCIIMVFCYIKVFMAMRRQSLRVTAAESDNPSSFVMTSSNQMGSLVEKQGQEREVESRHPSGDPHQASSSSSVATHVQYLSVSNCHSNSHRDAQNSSFSESCNKNGTSITPKPAKNQRRKRANFNSQNQQRERRIFITLTYILSSYLICWFPFYIVFDTYAWKPDLVPAGLYTFFFWLTYVNSTLNPLIYAYTNKEFRAAFIKVLKLIFKCSRT